MLELINPELQLAMFTLGERFQKNTPFPHLVLDQFFRPDFAQSLLNTFPKFDPQKALNELGAVGGKAVHQNIRVLAQPYKDLDDLVQSEDFLKFVSGITRIPDLIYDPDYVGGGTHENLHGQELDPHADFNYHPSHKWHRRLNLLVYLNPHWEEEWGGSIELHSDPWHPEENEVKSSMPIMNRCLIFETSERSWHGFRQIKLPDNRRELSRKSIAFYFYTRERPHNEIRPEHGTFYIPRQPSEHILAGHTLTETDVSELKTILARRDSWIKFLYERELKFSSELGEKNARLQELSSAHSQGSDDGGSTLRADELQSKLKAQREFARLQKEFDERGLWAMGLEREVHKQRGIIAGLETKIKELERLDADLNSRAFLLKQLWRRFLAAPTNISQESILQSNTAAESVGMKNQRAASPDGGCPVCTCPHVDIIAAKNVEGSMFRVMECMNVECLHGFVSPLPTQELLDRMYADENLNTYLEDEKYVQNVSQFLKHLLEHYVPLGFEKPGTLLDIGAGTGTFVKCANAYGWNSSGIEYNERSTRLAEDKYGVHLVQGSFYSLERHFPHGAFDLIVMTHVFEHVLDPLAFIHYVADFLKPNGCIMVCVPNILSDDCRKDGALWSYIHIPAHISYFSRFSLDALFLQKSSIPGRRFIKIFQSSFPSPEQVEGEGLTAMFRLVNE